MVHLKCNALVVFGVIVVFFMMVVETRMGMQSQASFGNSFPGGPGNRQSYPGNNHLSPSETQQQFRGQVGPGNRQSYSGNGHLSPSEIQQQFGGQGGPGNRPSYPGNDQLSPSEIQQQFGWQGGPGDRQSYPGNDHSSLHRPTRLDWAGYLSLLQMFSRLNALFEHYGWCKRTVCIRRNQATTIKPVCAKYSARYYRC